MRALRSKLTGSMLPSGVSANWAGPNRGPASTTSPPPNSRTNSSVIWQNRGLKAAAGKIAQKDHVVGEELAPWWAHRRQEQLVRLPHPRVGRPQERAESLRAHQLVAIKHLLDEPPFPGRLVFDEQQAEEVVAHRHFTLGPVVIAHDLALDRVDLGGEHVVTRFFRHIGTLDFLDGAGKRHRYLGQHRGRRFGRRIVLRAAHLPDRKPHAHLAVVKPLLPDGSGHDGAFVFFHHQRRLQLDRHVDRGRGTDADRVERHAEPPGRLDCRRPGVLLEVAEHHHAGEIGGCIAASPCRCTAAPSAVTLPLVVSCPASRRASIS